MCVSRGLTRWRAFNFGPENALSLTWMVVIFLREAGWHFFGNAACRKQETSLWEAGRMQSLT
jgi:hypothetical protein